MIVPVIAKPDTIVPKIIKQGISIDLFRIVN